LPGKIVGDMWVDASPIPLELTHFIKSSNVLNARGSLVYQIFVRGMRITQGIVEEKIKKFEY